jgi:hypothetical protein
MQSNNKFQQDHVLTKWLHRHMHWWHRGMVDSNNQNFLLEHTGILRGTEVFLL